MKKEIKITPQAIEEAKKHPNGWLYVIDEAFNGQEEIPPTAILGCWKVNENGEITGDFIANPNYMPLDSI